MIAFTAFSQSNYPRPVVIDGDTGELISRAQMRSLIMLQYSYDECDSFQQVLSGEEYAERQLAARQDSAFSSAQEEMQGYDAEVRLLNSQISLRGQELTVNKNLMKLKQRSAWAGGVTGSLVAGAVGLIVGFFIHR